MQFGFTLKPDHTIERTLALTRQAEAAGFEYGWLFDSHVLWRDPYPAPDADGRGDRADAPGDLRHEPGHPRADRHRVGPGDPRRDQRRADGPRDRARRLGAARARQAADHDGPHSRRRSGSSGRLVEGRTIEYEGTELHFPWTKGWTLPVWVAGYGPMALAMTGRVADGLILQLATRTSSAGSSARSARPRRRPGATRRDPGPGGGRGLRRSARARSRADALVPGARLQPRRRPRQQVPARAAPRRA